MKKLKTNKKKSLINSIMSGMIVGLLIVVIGALLIGILQNKEILEITLSNASALIVQFAATMAAGFVAAKRQGEKYAVLCSITGLLTAAAMLLTTLTLFRCEFERVGWGLLACLLGSVSGCICTMLSGKKHKRKMKNW